MPKIDNETSYVQSNLFCSDALEKGMNPHAPIEHFLLMVQLEAKSDITSHIGAKSGINFSRMLYFYLIHAYNRQFLFDILS